MIEKIFTYEDLPKKGVLPALYHKLSDTIILEHLNRIVKDANFLSAIHYTETINSDNLPEVTITFKMLLSKDDKS